MQVLTFQNYNVARELAKNGIFKSTIRRDWVEEAKGFEATKMLYSRLSNQLGEEVTNGVFGLRKINITLGRDEEKESIRENVEMDIDSMSKFVGKYENLIDDLIGVTTMYNATALICLDIPDEYILEYSQSKLNTLVKNGELTDEAIDNVLVSEEEGITSCIIPYIKSDWVTGVYTFTHTSLGEVVTLRLDENCTSLTVHSAYVYEFIGHNLINVTSYVRRKEFTIEDVLEKYNTFNGWECQDEFNQELFLEWLCMTSGVKKEIIDELNIEVDTDNIFESVWGIVGKLADYL